VSLIGIFCKDHRLTRKLVQYFAEVLNYDRDKLNENLVMNNSKGNYCRIKKNFRKNFFGFVK
jgi:hypothetical protein